MINKLNIHYNNLKIIRNICFCFLIAFLIISFGIRKETVKGHSMYPTLKNSQTVLINVTASIFTTVHRFDVVVVKLKDSKEQWVKRIIGLPNETIRYDDDQLYINGKKIAESFLNKQYIKKVLALQGFINFTKDFSYKLHDNEYFLLGDNRLHSIDSREIGVFHREQMIAKGMLVFEKGFELKYLDNKT